MGIIKHFSSVSKTPKTGVLSNFFYFNFITLLVSSIDDDNAPLAGPLCEWTDFIVFKSMKVKNNFKFYSAKVIEAMKEKGKIGGGW